MLHAKRVPRVSARYKGTLFYYNKLRANRANRASKNKGLDMDLKEYMTPSEVAKEFQMSIRRVQERAKAGDFHGAIKPFGRILIPRKTVEEMKNATLGGNL